MGRVVAALVFALSSGCLILDSDDGPVSRQQACLSVCECLFFSPTAAQSCADECATDPDILPPSQTCLECLTVNTCESIETGGCNDACSSPEPSQNGAN